MTVRSPRQEPFYTDTAFHLCGRISDRGLNPPGPALSGGPELLWTWRSAGISQTFLNGRLPDEQDAVIVGLTGMRSTSRCSCA